MAFGPEALRIDPAGETDRIGEWLRHSLGRVLRRRGVVIGLSGGIDSTVTAALAVRALGPRKVFGLLMPERHSESDTDTLGQTVAEWLGIDWVREDITAILESLGFYRRYAAAAARAIPGYTQEWRSKLVKAEPEGQGFSFFWLVAQAPDGTEFRERLGLQPYLEIVAATNFKQRTRKMLEYYHADRLHFAVVGTPNRLEFDQGFFVKNGDGAADLKPIAHLYKTQVYQLAEFLGVPDTIRQRPPTTDTYSLAQGQDEFYFSVPYHQLDVCLYAHNHGMPRAVVAQATGLTPDQVDLVWADIEAKRAATRYLHRKALLPEPVQEVDHG